MEAFVLHPCNRELSMPARRSVALDSVQSFHLTTARDSVRRDASRSHSKVLPGNDHKLGGKCRTSAVLEGGGSSQHGLLLERPSVLI